MLTIWETPHSGFDATSLTKAGKGVARFQREVLRAADAHDLIDELDIFVPLEPDEAALPQRDGWRYHPVRTSPMVAWEQLRRPALARRLRLDVVLTASERAALWGPREVAYVYEHPRHRAQRSREVGLGLRRLQTGLVRNYALGIVFGAVALMVWFATRISF